MARKEGSKDREMEGEEEGDWQEKEEKEKAFFFSKIINAGNLSCAYYFVFPQQWPVPSHFHCYQS